MLEMIYQKDRICIILDKGIYNGFNYAIVSYGTHPCCYVFLPKGHKYYGKNYDDIDIVCHGGLTYSNDDLLFNPLENDKWVIGWDYAHYNDYHGSFSTRCGRVWTTKELLEDVKEVIEQLAESEVQQNG